MEWPGNSQEMIPIENVLNIMKKEMVKMTCKRKRCGSEYVEHGIV